jgi:hypothetical protein
MLDALKLKLQNRCQLSEEKYNALIVVWFRDFIIEYWKQKIHNVRRHIPLQGPLNRMRLDVCLYVFLCDRHSMIRLDSVSAFIVHFENCWNIGLIKNEINVQYEYINIRQMPQDEFNNWVPFKRRRYCASNRKRIFHITCGYNYNKLFWTKKQLLH